MILPLVFIVMIVVLVVLPAILGWKLSRIHSQSIRMAGTIGAGQIILTPVVIWASQSSQMISNANPVRTIVIYACMAIMISLMTFVVLEMRNSGGKK